jgi:hypothetical protein
MRDKAEKGARPMAVHHRADRTTRLYLFRTNFFRFREFSAKGTLNREVRAICQQIVKFLSLLGGINRLKGDFAEQECAEFAEF